MANPFSLDFVKFYQNRNKTQPLGKEPALIPVESIYLNEELNFETRIAILIIKEFQRSKR